MNTVVDTKRSATRWLLWTVVLLGLGLFGYVQLVLHWSYSEGDRVGILQKVSKKGWICKTDEGELALYVVGGVAPQIWEFTVRDDEVMKQLEAHLGERVRLHYSEHRGIPTSCFGDTTYFVDAVAPAP
ncbi:MAG TPA: hypothetical protein VHL14_00380 [Steroidobacteraceae bacterium]|nr:hypothetical protein [Steroidobacteraceae bacterium]